MNSNITRLFSLIASSRHCVALTGAGISVASGIPGFRGKNGLYTAGLPQEILDSYPPEVLALYLSGLPGERAFDIEEFEQDPAVFYTNAGPLVYTVHEKEPSLTHRVLAELERRGLLKAVITQNIDMLHQKAQSQRVIELHGSPRIHYCLRCAGIRVSYAEALAALSSGDMPRCPRCDRVLKPAITFYGESLPLEARREAEAEAQDADLMLILGTSLMVTPAATIPRTTMRRGGSLVIVNDTKTPLDEDAAMRFWNLEELFKGLEELLGSSGV